MKLFTSGFRCMKTIATLLIIRTAVRIVNAYRQPKSMTFLDYGGVISGGIMVSVSVCAA